MKPFSFSSPSSSSSTDVAVAVVIGTTLRYIIPFGISGYALFRLVIQRYISFFKSPLHKVPGPKCKSFLFGYFWDIFREPFMGPHKRWIAQAILKEKEKDYEKQQPQNNNDNKDNKDNTSKLLPPIMSYSSLFGSWSILVLDPDLVGQILMENATKEPIRYPKRYDFLKQIAGEGLAVLEGSQWSRHRRIVQPCFQTVRVTEQLNTAIPPLMERFLAAWDKVATTSKKKSNNNNNNNNNTTKVMIDVQSHLSALTLDILGHVSFSYDFGGVQVVENWATTHTSTKTTRKKTMTTTLAAQEKSNDGSGELTDIPDPFLQALKASFQLSLMDIFLAIVGATSLVNWIDPKSAKSRRMLDEAAADILEKARSSSSSSGGGGGTNNKDGTPHSTSRQQQEQEQEQQSLRNEQDEEKKDDNEKTPTTSTSPPGSAKKNKSLLQQLFDAKPPSENSTSTTTTTTTNNNNNPTTGAGDVKNKRTYLTEKELRDEITSFIVAGHDTTSTWCHWAIYALGLYPDIQEKVFQDIAKHCDSNNNNAIVTLQDVNKMSYFLAFMQEVLRFYSPVGMIIRYTAQEEIMAGYTIPADTRLCIPIHLLHRHPDHWKDPDTFNPDRWLLTANHQHHRHHHKFAFLPFSTGPRNCVGSKFAEVEAKLIVANIVRTFQIELEETTKERGVSFTIFLAMKSKLPVRIHIAKRSGSGPVKQSECDDNDKKEQESKKYV